LFDKPSERKGFLDHVGGRTFRPKEEERKRKKEKKKGERGGGKEEKKEGKGREEVNELNKHPQKQKKRSSLLQSLGVLQEENERREGNDVGGVSASLLDSLGMLQEENEQQQAWAAGLERDYDNQSG